MAIKLHTQFAHPSGEKLSRLVQNSSYDKKTLRSEIKNLSENCKVCIVRRKTKPRPIVCIPLATTFNEMVALDLKFHTHEGRTYIFLVFVDIATRFCAAKVIVNKKPETIVSAILSKWISIFGAPRKIFSDNGREFHNPQVRQLSETFSFKVYTTAAESPWSNGIVERLNGILGMSVSKIMEDVKCDVHMALSWAVAA